MLFECGFGLVINVYCKILGQPLKKGLKSITDVLREKNATIKMVN